MRICTGEERRGRIEGGRRGRIEGGRREEGGRKARKGCTCRIIGVHEGAMPTDAPV